MYNRNKRSLCVDLKHAEGKRLVHGLTDHADVVIENFRPGAMEKLGFGYAELSARNEQLVYCALKGFLRGPYEHRAALDEVAQMMGGLAYMTGLPGRPMRAGSSGGHRRRHVRRHRHIGRAERTARHGPRPAGDERAVRDHGVSGRPAHGAAGGARRGAAADVGAPLRMGRVRPLLPAPTASSCSSPSSATRNGEPSATSFGTPAWRPSPRIRPWRPTAAESTTATACCRR